MNPTHPLVTAILCICTLTLLTPTAHAVVFPTDPEIDVSFKKCRMQPKLVCVFQPTPGNSATGNVTFTTTFNKGRPEGTRCRVTIAAKLANLTPGSHGFHIHTYGDMRSSDAASLGGHFSNPAGDDLPHGFPNDAARHWGDFGNVVADSDGFASYGRKDKVITLAGIVGRGMVLHASADLGASEQPSGASGPRQASCVIGFANPGL